MTEREKVPPDKELLDGAIQRRNPVAARIDQMSKAHQIKSLRDKLTEAHEGTSEWRGNYLILSAMTEDALDALTGFISSLDTSLPEDVQKVIADHVEQKFAYALNKEANQVWKKVKEKMREVEGDDERRRLLGRMDLPK